MPAARKIVVFYDAHETGTQTILEYLRSFSSYLAGSVEFLNVTRNAWSDIDLSQYDVVINNYCARLCVEGYVPVLFRNKLKNFTGLKILIAQDEYENIDTLKSAIREIGFHVLLTLTPPHSIEKIYPQRELPGLRRETVLAGYVPHLDYVPPDTAKPLAERPIWVGYRARDLGGLYGRLGFEKYEIGRGMKAVCDSRGIPCDIAMDHASRIYGTAWYDFIGNCRTMLGTDSGCNVLDHDGSLRRQFAALTRQRGGRPPSYEEFKPYIGDREDGVDYSMISPRIFEYARARAAMILFRGRYSGILDADKHFILLEPDFSNVDDVIARLHDISFLQSLADQAFDDLIASNRFSYKSFAAFVGSLIDEELAKLRAFPVSKPCAQPNEARPHPMLQETATAAPILVGDRTFALRETFVGFEAEVNRMGRVEDQVLDGFMLAAAEMREAAVPGDGAREARLDALDEAIRVSGQRLHALAEARAAVTQALQAESSRWDLAFLEASTGLYEQQMHEMYALFGALDGAHREAAAFAEQAHSV